MFSNKYSPDEHETFYKIIKNLTNAKLLKGSVHTRNVPVILNK